MLTETAELRSEADWREHYRPILQRLNPRLVPQRRERPPVAPMVPFEWVSAQDFIPPSPELPEPGSTRGLNGVATIVKAASRHFGVPISEIMSRRHLAVLVRPRHIAMYLSLYLTKASYPAIGKFMGGRDHTTIMNGVRRISDKLKVDPTIAADIEAVRTLAIEADPRLGSLA